MTDHPDLASFELFTMGALEDDAAFVAHVSGCEACSATLAREAALELLMKDVPARPRALRTVTRLAVPFAAIAVAAAVLVAARHRTPSRDKTTSTATAASSDGDLGPEVKNDPTLQARATACWEAGAATDPNMEGRVDVEATIAPEAHVSRAVLVRNEGLSDEVVQCVVRAFRTAQFPPWARTYTYTPGFVFLKVHGKR